MAASLPDELDAAAWLDHRSLETKGEGWRSKELMNRPALGFSSQGRRASRSALLSMRTLSSRSSESWGLAKRGGSACPQDEARRAGPETTVDPSPRRVPSPVQIVARSPSRTLGGREGILWQLSEAEPCGGLSGHWALLPLAGGWLQHSLGGGHRW